MGNDGIEIVKYGPPWKGGKNGPVVCDQGIGVPGPPRDHRALHLSVSDAIDRIEDFQHRVTVPIAAIEQMVAAPPSRLQVLGHAPTPGR